MARVCQLLAISLPMGCYAHCFIHMSYVYATPKVRLCYALLSYNCLPQLRPALRTELGGAIGLGAAVGAELMDASGGRGEG